MTSYVKTQSLRRSGLLLVCTLGQICAASVQEMGAWQHDFTEGIVGEYNVFVGIEGGGVVARRYSDNYGPQYMSIRISNPAGLSVIELLVMSQGSPLDVQYDISVKDPAYNNGIFYHEDGFLGYPSDSEGPSTNERAASDNERTDCRFNRGYYFTGELKDAVPLPALSTATYDGGHLNVNMYLAQHGIHFHMEIRNASAMNTDTLQL